MENLSTQQELVKKSDYYEFGEIKNPKLRIESWINFNREIEKWNSHSEKMFKLGYNMMRLPDFNANRECENGINRFKVR